MSCRLFEIGHDGSIYVTENSIVTECHHWTQLLTVPAEPRKTDGDYLVVSWWMSPLEDGLRELLGATVTPPSPLVLTLGFQVLCLGKGRIMSDPVLELLIERWFSLFNPRNCSILRQGFRMRSLFRKDRKLQRERRKVRWEEVAANCRHLSKPIATMGNWSWISKKKL